MKGKLRASAIRTLIVVGLFGALLAYVLLVEAKKEAPTMGEVTPTPSTILEGEVDDLAALEVSDGERTLRIERQEGAWRIVAAPDGGAAREADTSEMAFAVDEWMPFEARLAVMDEVSDPATYGLDRPALTLVLEMRAGDRAQIMVGREIPDGTAFYVQRAGDPRLYIVSHFKIEPLFNWLLSPPYQATPTPSTLS